MKKESIDPKGLEMILAIVGKKLGIPPEQLKKELQEGKFDSALSGMNPKEAAKFQQAISNPKMVDMFMSNPQAKSLYENLKNS